MKKKLGLLLAVVLVSVSFAQITSATTESWKSRSVSLSGAILYPTADSVTGKTFLVSPTGGIYANNSVTILNKANKIESTILLNGVPYYGTFAISPASKEFYVTMFEPLTSSTTIFAISTNDDSVKQIVLGSQASNMAYDSDRNEMNILVKESNVWHLVALDANDNVTSDTTIAPTYSTEMVYDPSNKSIDIVDGVAQKIYIVDTTSRNITTLSVPNIGSPFYQGVVYNPSNHYVYVLGQHNQITVLSGNGIIGTVTVPPGPSSPGNLNRLGYSPANNEIYVSETYFGAFIYTIKDLAVVGSPITVSIYPTSFAYDPSDMNMYVVDYTANNVTVISPSNTIVGTVSLSPNINPESIIYNPVTGLLHIPVYAVGGKNPQDILLQSQLSK